MNFKIALNFAKKNIAANKQLIIPFILASSLMLMLFNIMSSLAQNDYVNTRHNSLILVINFGIVIILMFIFVFIIYANRFLMKRRNKELALYGILGLEKRHIVRIVFIEQLINFSIISLLSIIGGFLLGKVTFLALNRLMKDVSGRLMDYPFSQTAFINTITFILVLFVVIFFINIFSIKNLSPMELLSKQYKGDGEPKNKLFLLLLGTIILIGGYYLALTIEGTLRSLVFFFLAALLVAIATYILFMTLSIFILKKMKANKIFYYRDKNFLSISGMLYRMKANAIGLASIAVLCTGVIVTISTTATIYTNIEANAENALPTEYSISAFDDYDSPNDKVKSDKNRETVLNFVKSSALDNMTITDLYIEEWIMVPLFNNNGELLPVDSNNINFLSSEVPIYTVITTLDDYNQTASEKQKLSSNELLVFSNNEKLLNFENLEVNGQVYKTKKLKDTFSSRIAVDSYKIVVPDYEHLNDFANYFKLLDTQSGQYHPARMALSAYWNIEGENENYEMSFENNILKFNETNEIAIGGLESKNNIKSLMYELNGGFLFLGAVIGLLFVTGTVLVTYYKQISEGYEDRNQFQIMKKVGLPDKLIKKTASNQIIWMFFTPLIVGIIHSLVASKIVFQLLRLFGVTKYMELGVNMTIISGAFAIAYLCIFKISSNVYYKLVK